MKGNRVCELCREEATLYCDSDSAFLCWTCDAEVHSANFLVARHIRRPICSNCKAFAGNCISGVAHWNIRSLCPSCSGEDQAVSSASSVCVSTNESSAAAAKSRLWDRPMMKRIGSSSAITDLAGEESRYAGEVTSGKTRSQKKKEKENEKRDPIRPSVDEKAEGLFGKWCEDLGLNGNSRVVASASHALAFCVGRSKVLPFRVSLAASFWHGLRSCGDKSVRTFGSLRRLEEVSGVPGKVISAVELKLARELRVSKSRRHDLELEEGWAECSG